MTGSHEIPPAVERLIVDTRERTHHGFARRERLGHLASTATFLVAAAALALLAPSERSLDPLLAVLLVATFSVVARIEIAAGAGFVVPTQLLFVPLLLLTPTPLAPLLVAGALVLSDLVAAARRRLDLNRVMIAPGNAWFSLAPALVLVLAGAQEPRWEDWPWYVAALAAQLGGDALLTIVRARLTLGVRAAELGPDLVLACRVDALLAPVGLLMAFGAAPQPYAVLLVLPLLSVLTLLAREREARIDGALELSRAYRGTALLLGDVIEADDEYTGAHTKDVVVLTLQVADAIGVDEETRRLAELGALLHDVGKLGIPNAIINKPGPLDPAEWEVIRTHTIEGQRMLERVGGVLAGTGVVVRASHERWDGGGYPDGLAGEAIPLAARIVAACDSFNAMTTDRTYRRALPVAEAVEELRRCAGTQFDPAVVDALIEVVAAEPRWQLTLLQPQPQPAASEQPQPAGSRRR